MFKLKQIAIALAVAAAMPSLAHAALQYDLTLIGPATYGSATSINNAGVVVGSYYNYSTFQLKGFAWSKGTLSSFGAVGSGDYATGVNQSGAISLTGGELDIEYGTAYRYSNGVYTHLGTLAYGATTRAYGLNNSGVVVGDSGLGADTWEDNALRHAAMFQNGQAIDLGTLGGAQSTARSINDSSTVVGWSEVAGGNYHAYIYSQGTMSDLGTLGGNYSIAQSINNLGDVVGSSTDASGKRWAALWDNGAAQSLGWIGAAADINELGQVVGSGDNSGYLYSHGIAYNLNSLIDPSSGLTITSANGINDLGQIVGQACDSFGECSAVLLTPVPEPETYGMMLAGLGVIAYAARRRRQRAM